MNEDRDFGSNVGEMGCLVGRCPAANLPDRGWTTIDVLGTRTHTREKERELSTRLTAR